MVTKKTRWLSAIAAVIMLVSMLAGIVVPAGAESGSAILAEILSRSARKLSMKCAIILRT